VKKGLVIGLAIVALVLSGAALIRTAEAGPQITVYKSPACGCCNDWIDHLEEEGFQVTAVNADNMPVIKAANGIRTEISSCHTALVEGYVVEGHVPGSTLKRFLSESPEMAGLTVPGMPVGSPGMEMPGQPAQPYDVLSIDPAGNTEVYESFR